MNQYEPSIKHFVAMMKCQSAGALIQNPNHALYKAPYAYEMNTTHIHIDFDILKALNFPLLCHIGNRSELRRCKPLGALLCI